MMSQSSETLWENSPGFDIVRMGRVTALFFDSIDHGAWPFLVGGVIVWLIPFVYAKRSVEKR